MLLSKFQGTQALIHYIERSTTQLVEYKALNLVDVGSSPMVEITLYDVIFNEVYIKSQLSIILLSRPLGATRCCSSLHDHIYKVLAHYCLMTRPLGATLVEVFMGIRQLQVPGCCKHNNPTLGGYIVQIEITSNIQVPCHCQHAPWHLGANAKLFFWLNLLKTRLITF